MTSLAGWGTGKPEGGQARGSRSLDRLLAEQEGHLSHSGHSHCHALAFLSLQVPV